MPTIFPKWPHILFGIVEPLFLLGGYLTSIFNLYGFIYGQTPQARAPPLSPRPGLEPSTLALAYQLANIYLLLFMLGIAVCHTTTEPKVLRHYLIALALADLGHLWSTYAAMGWDSFWDFSGWGAIAFGNIAVTGFLFVNRVMYLWGWFGEAKAPRREKRY
ncbi:hypothetical protein VTN02DRAFT_6419 [Thermoascus thermophilus]